MIGINTIISNKLKQFNTNNLSFLKHEDWYTVDTLFESNTSKLLCSHYKGYPLKKWDNDRFFILQAGMIYNLSEADINSKILNIAEEFHNNRNFKFHIKHFVDNADGDFIIQIYDKLCDKYILFNDLFGRLPVYYYLSNDVVLISHEIKFILHYMPEIHFDKMKMVENLMFGHSFGERTIIKEVKRINPSEYLIVENKNKNLEINIGQTTEFNFKTKKRYRNKQNSLIKLREQFLTATENRISVLRQKGYRIQSGLSGGFDSRANIGGLSKFDKQVYYFTHEYIQDESKEAKITFESLASPGIYDKFNFKNEVNFEEVSKLVYKTDGLLNYLTTSVCYNDWMFLTKTSKNIDCNFMGLGGEFIRHPVKNWIFSIAYGIDKNLYTYLALNEACQITNTDYNDCRNELRKHFNGYSETKRSDKLKHFYYEYYRNYVGFAGEELGRMFNWNAQPMWSKDFVQTISHRIPLKWTGYKYFIEFMRLIDTRLLEAPIYNKDVNLMSGKSIDKYEADYQKGFGLKRKIRRYIKIIFPFFVKIYNPIIGSGKQNIAPENEGKKELHLFYEYYNKLEKCKALFDIKSVEKYIYKSGGDYNRLVTLAMYLYELEKRYSNKIFIE